MIKTYNLLPVKMNEFSAFKNRFLGLFVLLLFSSLGLSAQSFPVQVIPQVNPPAPIYFSDYTDAGSISGPLRVQIILNDLNISNRQVLLRISFKGNGISFQSKENVIGATPLFLEGGVPLVLTNAELSPYYEYQNISGISPTVYGSDIPEGTYKFCFEVLDALSGSQLSSRSCVTSLVFQNEPPLLMLPRDKANVKETNPQNILFQWTPRSINVSNVEYELTLVEIWDTQVDPQQAFLSSVPIFQTTTSSTTYLYGPSAPLLLSNKKYAWRVQAKAKKGTEEIGLFKNKGFSEIFYFSHAQPCDLPLGINHEVKGSTNVNIFWEDYTTEIPEFIVRYRKKGEGNNWFQNKTSMNSETLWGLKGGTTYEYQIQKSCKITKSDWSAAKEFTTHITDNQGSVYECGITPDFNMTNKDPLATLSKGDVFIAGDFPVKVNEVTGSNGRFSGKGYVTIPYLNSIKVGVEFTNVLVNTDKKLAEGVVNTMYDPNAGNILDIDEAIDTTGNITDAVGEVFEDDSSDLEVVKVDFVIDPNDPEKDIKIEDGNVIITNPSTGEKKTEPLDDDIVVVDSAGNTYHVAQDGKITKGGQIDAEGGVTTGNILGVSKDGTIESLTAKGIVVTFEDDQISGYDAMPKTANNKIKKEYHTIKDGNDNDYTLIHLSIEEEKTVKVMANVTQLDNVYKLSDIVFKTKTGEVLPSKEINGKIELTLTGRYSLENETIYAVVPSKTEEGKQLTAGAFTLWHFTKKSVDVVLVSVDGAPLPDTKKIGDIFKKGIAILNFETKSAALDISLLGEDGKLEIGDSPWLVAYNKEQKVIIKNLKKQIDYSSKKYYVFVFKDGFKTTKDIAGFMPLQRQFGFVFNGGLSSDEEGKGDLAKVTAHEVAHGIFALQHPFTTYGNDIKGKTPWLMDYAKGDLLNHMDWAQIHDPNLKFYIFQDEEDGEYDSYELVQKVFQEIRCAYLNNNIDDSAQLQTIKGYLSRISEFRSLINLADETIEFCVEYDDEKELIFNKNITPAEGDFDKSNLEWLYNLMNVTPPKKFKYKYTFGGLTIYTQKSDFESYINPTKERVREDLMNVWSKINIENGITQSEFLKLKSIAACATQLISTPNRIKLIRELSKGNLLESREDLILDILQTTPKEEQIYILDFLYDEFEVFTSLYQKMNNSNLVSSENNKSRFINTIYSFWEDSSYSKSDNTTYSYINNESPKIIGYDDKGKFERGFTSRELKFKLVKSNKAIKVIKEDPGNMDDQAITIYEYTYHPFQPIVIYSIEDENKVNVISNTVPVFFFMGIEDIKDANARAAAWGLTFDSLLMVTGVGEISALRNLSGVYKATKATILGVEITTSALDIILNYSTICNGNEESCQKIKKINFWLQLGSLSSDLLTQRIIRQSAKDALGYSGIPANTRKELEVLAGKKLADAGSGLLTKLKKFPSLDNSVNGLDDILKPQFLDDFANASDDVLKKLQDDNLFDVWKNDIRSNNIDELTNYLSKGKLRNEYIEVVKSLKGEVDKLLAQGKPKLEVAQTISARRRKISTDYKGATPDDLLEHIFDFNNSRYTANGWGDELGQTWEGALKRQKDLKGLDPGNEAYDNIIRGASTPLGTKEQLGAALYKTLGDDVLPVLKKYRMY